MEYIGGAFLSKKKKPIFKLAVTSTESSVAGDATPEDGTSLDNKEVADSVFDYDVSSGKEVSEENDKLELPFFSGDEESIRFEQPLKSTLNSELQSLNKENISDPLSNNGSFYTPPSLAVSDPYRQRMKLIRVLLLLGFISGVGVKFFTDKSWQVAALRFVDLNTDDELVGQVPRENFRADRKVHSKKSEWLKNIDGKRCETIIRRGARIYQGAALASKVRFRLADCFFTARYFSQAELLIKPLLYTKFSKRFINKSIKTTNGLGEIYLLYVQLLIREGRLVQAQELSKSMCSSWSENYACLGWLMSEVSLGDYSVANTYYTKMSRSSFVKGYFLKPYLLLIGAKIAQYNNQFLLVESRLKSAFRSSSDKVNFLLKELYTERLHIAFVRKKLPVVRSLSSRIYEGKKFLNNEIYWKFVLLRDLLSSKNPQQVLRSFFMHFDSLKKARVDLNFVEIISLYAIKQNQGKMTENFLNDAYNLFKDVFKADESILLKLRLLLMRAYVSSRDFRMSVRSAMPMRKTNNSYIFHHLKAISFMLSSSSERAQLAAAKEFQVALREKKTWQSRFGLALSLLRAKDLRRSHKVIYQLSRLSLPGVGVYWFNLLQAEWLLANKQSSKALLLVNKQLAFKKTMHALELKIAILKNMNKGKGVQKVQMDIDYILRQGSKGLESLVSPLSALVFL